MMLSSSLRGIARRAVTGSRTLQLQQVRYLNLHEYQCASIMKDCGVNVPFGIPAMTVDEAVNAANEIGDDQVVIKSQILAGGRGLGKFMGDDGLQGGVHVIDTTDVEDYASKMLGNTLVTKQSGPKGKPVNTVYVVKKLMLKHEYYFAIMMDRTIAQGPLIVCSREGGTSIEELAVESPEKIIKIPIDINEGITAEQINKVVDTLLEKDDDSVSSEQRDAAGDQIKALYELFITKDCTMVEVNPLALDVDGNLVAADAKIGFDDNANFRQQDIHAMRDYTQEDSREVEANKYDLNYIGFDGSIGFMVNGAGLAMATMDAVSLYGGSPANFLDVGGAASKDQIQGAFSIISQDPNVKAILVNIFGGIMRCDTIAQGVIDATKSLDLEVPVVVRLEGTNVNEGKKLLNDSGLALITADNLDDAAQKVVALVK